MRPTKQETDLEFWANARAYWAQRVEEWFLLTAKDASGFAAAQEENARKRLFVAELAHQEAQGLITVYSGRKNPGWAR